MHLIMIHFTHSIYSVIYPDAKDGKLPFTCAPQRLRPPLTRSNPANDSLGNTADGLCVSNHDFGTTWATWAAHHLIADC